MKINNGKIFIKFFSLLSLLFALLPIVEIEKFYIFIFIITIIIFSKIRNKIHYFRLLLIILILILIKFLQSNLYFHEGNNILILNEKSKPFYQNYLPNNMFAFLVKEYDFYKINSNCAYASDVNEIYKKDYYRLKNLKYLIIDCLRYNYHPSHYNLQDVLKLVDVLKPKKTILTNLANDIDYKKVQKYLPKNVVPAYDGMNFLI